MLDFDTAVLALPLLFCGLALAGVILAYVAWSDSAGLTRQLQQIADRLIKLEADADRTTQGLREGLRDLRADSGHAAREAREELRTTVMGFGDSLQARVDALGGALGQRLSGFEDSQLQQQRALAERMTQSLLEVTTQLQGLLEANERRQDQIRRTLTESLETLRRENEAKLEQMRQTVDEKLQGALEKRIGESFQIVSERLERVHQGLGEMQTLATGVGDLKRVLTNVKTRGTWAEVQLGALLENMLSPEQFVRNAQIKPDVRELVEFAIKMPGQDDGAPVLLPIDAKFPLEDYERLHAAQLGGKPEEIEAAANALAAAIRKEAKRISDKYIAPPLSTDFAIMYLPTEGLFAEVIRHGNLMAELQQAYRVTIAGPTTLSAFLNALQMGFRTLAIQKRSSEVWKILGEAKAQFESYGQVWEKLARQLDTAQRTVEEAGKRTKAVARKLRGVESIETPSMADDLFQLAEELDHAGQSPIAPLAKTA